MKDVIQLIECLNVLIVNLNQLEYWRLLWISLVMVLIVILVVRKTT